jgi:cell division protein FtsI (penicillin-binding protein 3)
VQGKKGMTLPVSADSSLFTYAGYTPDVRNVFEQVNMKPVDSASKTPWSIIYSNNYKPVIKGNPVFKNHMPDLYHMTLKDALYELENRNMKVVVKGRGKVVAQDIAPGTTISKDQTVNLLLN